MKNGFVVRLRWWCVWLLLLCCHCAGSAETPRTAYLRDLLIEDNWDILRRLNEQIEAKQRDLFAEKLSVMARDLYAYFRGTVLVYLRDQTMLSGGSTPTAFGSPESAYVSAVIDPHPENIGTYLAADRSQRIDFNDFDGSTYGPFTLDVRRMLLGFWIAAQAVDFSEEDRGIQDRLGRVIAGAYFDEIMRQKQGGQPLRLRPNGQHGVLIADLFRRALRDGDARESLDEYTRLEDGRRVMFTGVVEADTGGVISDRVGPVDGEEERLLREVLRRYPSSLADPGRFPKEHFIWKGASQRFGAGVSSYPRLRYYILVEGPTQAVEDDILLEVKEITNPPLLPGFLLFPKQPFPDNAARVAWMQRRLQEDANNDPYLGFASISPMAFRIRQRTKYQKNFSVSRFREKYKEGDWKAADLEIFAGWASRLLARAHAQAPTIRQKPGLNAIAALLEGKRDAFVREQEAFLRSYGPQTLQDFQSLGPLLKRYGPRLGYVASPWRF